MSKDHILTAFAALPLGEQEEVRAQRAGEALPGEEAGGFVALGEDLLKKMKTGGSTKPTCREMVQKLAETCCVSGWRP